jgi:hypothetical protein
MPRAAIKLHFFLDNNVPDSIGRYLQGRGHSVHRQRFYIPANSPDPLVATTALEAGRILITQDRDFNSQRFQQARFANLSRVGLSGPGQTLLAAMKEHIDLIEFQWARLQQAGAARMVVQIQVGKISFRA